MKIITVPHQTLRLKAEPIAKVDKKVLTWLKQLSHTLEIQKNPQGVGLAAPQVNLAKRAFATYLPIDLDNEESPSEIKLFINPEIVDHSNELIFGPDPEQPILEGCLSIPSLYGAVPRWQWIQLEYQTLVNGEVVAETLRATDFQARVIQHEHDHLNGILFTDYSLQLDLPVYFSSTKNRKEKMEEIDKRLIESF